MQAGEEDRASSHSKPEGDGARGRDEAGDAEHAADMFDAAAHDAAPRVALRMTRERS